MPWYRQADLFVDGPEELVRPLFMDWRSASPWDAGAWTRPIVARFELDARPVALRTAQVSLAGNRSVLLPFLDADGGMTLDYGPRRFVVGFDDQLKPYVRMRTASAARP
jgi:hypothetical protein